MGYKPRHAPFHNFAVSINTFCQKSTWKLFRNFKDAKVFGGTSSIAMAKRSERLLMWRLPICLTWSPFRQLYYSRALRYAVFRRADLAGTLCRVRKDFREFSPNFWNALFSWIVSFLKLFLPLISFYTLFCGFFADSMHISRVPWNTVSQKMCFFEKPKNT